MLSLGFRKIKSMAISGGLNALNWAHQIALDLRDWTLWRRQGQLTQWLGRHGYPFAFVFR